jgi:hypothetical protein
MKNITDGDAQLDGSKIPAHKHDPETCALYKCKFMQRDFKRSIHNTQKFIDDYDILQRYSLFVNRILITHTYRHETDPIIKAKYTAYLQKLK